jgi:hypothetical protein
MPAGVCRVTQRPKRDRLAEPALRKSSLPLTAASQEKASKKYQPQMHADARGWTGARLARSRLIPTGREDDAPAAAAPSCRRRPASTTVPLAARKIVDTGLRQYDVEAGDRESISRALGINPPADRNEPRSCDGPRPIRVHQRASAFICARASFRPARRLLRRKPRHKPADPDPTKPAIPDPTKKTHAPPPSPDRLIVQPR